MTAERVNAPLRSPLCPLCGQPNACQPAQTGSFAQPCWCQSATFAPELLASVPEGARNKACICQACASGGGSGSDVGGGREVQ